MKYQSGAFKQSKICAQNPMTPVRVERRFGNQFCNRILCKNKIFHFVNQTLLPFFSYENLHLYCVYSPTQKIVSKSCRWHFFACWQVYVLTEKTHFFVIVVPFLRIRLRMK